MGSSGVSPFLRAAGQILAVSYPVLALSTGVRGVYQLCCKPEQTDWIAPTITVVAALFYLLATLGFLIQRPWSWRVAVALLAFETLGVLGVGTLSWLQPEALGHTAWTFYGQDYGYLPLLQPVLGLWWLLAPVNRAGYFPGR